MTPQEYLETLQRLCAGMDRSTTRVADKNRDLRNQIEALRKTLNPKPQEDTMIEVGKITIAKEQYIAVMMNEDNVFISIRVASVATIPIPIPPTQALDLGQMLLKTYEAQADYAVAAKELDAQKSKLDAKYVDLISGLGLETLVDRLDENGGLKASGLKPQGLKS